MCGKRKLPVKAKKNVVAVPEEEELDYEIHLDCEKIQMAQIYILWDTFSEDRGMEDEVSERVLTSAEETDEEIKNMGLWVWWWGLFKGQLPLMHGSDPWSGVT